MLFVEIVVTFRDILFNFKLVPVRPVVYCLPWGIDSGGNPTTQGGIYFRFGAGDNRDGDEAELVSWLLTNIFYWNP